MMNTITRVTRTNRKESAISPTVGVILMVAVSVIMSATIGAFVLDLGNDQSSPAQAGVTVSENTDGSQTVSFITGGNADAVLVEFDSGSEEVSLGDSVTVPAGESFVVIGVLDGERTVLKSGSSPSGGGEPTLAYSDGGIVVNDANMKYDGENFTAESNLSTLEFTVTNMSADTNVPLGYEVIDAESGEYVLQDSIMPEDVVEGEPYTVNIAEAPSGEYYVSFHIILMMSGDTGHYEIDEVGVSEE